MTNKEIIELEIEKASLQEVINQFTKGYDARMETKLDEFLCEIRYKYKIEYKYATVSR